MGQKVHPIALRLGIVRSWDSKWFAPRSKYAEYLHEDIRLRSFVKKYLAHASVARVEIERFAQRVRINIHTARPGVVIGRSGAEVNQLRQKLQKMTTRQVDLNIHEIKNATVDAQLVAESVAQQLIRRISFRRTMRKAVSDTRRGGAEGIKIMVAGRLGGAEIARTEWYRDGRVPLHTLRADINYGFTEARTTYGVIGVKVWIFTKEILPEGKTFVEGRIVDFSAPATEVVSTTPPGKTDKKKSNKGKEA